MRTRTPKFIKKKVKTFHDNNIIRKTFEPNQKILSYNSRLNLFLGKLRSRWTESYIVQTVFLHSAIKIKNPTSGNIFKVNGQCLKLFLNNFASE